MILPLQGWMPESSADPDAITPAHYVPPGAQIELAQYGYDLIAACGRSAFPIYAADTGRQVARHPRCPDCDRLLREVTP